MPGLKQPPARPALGFTLVEAVVTLVVAGILFGIVASIVSLPVRGYADTVQRAQLTDIADTAERRLGRELHQALPNSVRVQQAGSKTYLEFLQTRGGGRYRAATDANGNGDILDFSNASDTSFDVLGPVPAVQPGDQLVVYNLGIPSDGTNNLGADAYEGKNRRAIDASGSCPAGKICFQPPSPAYPLPFASPSARFQVVESAVTYVCDPNAANPVAGTLVRYWNYPIQAQQPADVTAAPLHTASHALLASQVQACSITYQQGNEQRNGYIAIRLTLAYGEATVTLYNGVHIDNAP
jgi:MSHA biogenesis protein MshO